MLDLRARVRGPALFVGLMFAVVGTAVGLVFGGVVLLLERGPDRFLLLLPVLAGVVFLLGGLFLCASALAARLRVDGGGVLTVRSVPPWRTRRVALGRLATVEARHVGYLPGNRRRVAVRLRDGLGRTATVDPEAWTRPDLVAAAIARGAAASGIGPDPATARYLAEGVAP